MKCKDAGRLTNGHTGGDSMWVDDEVRHNAILCPGHVLLVVGDANSALLPMPAGKLVTHLGYPDRPHLTGNAQLSCLAQLPQTVKIVTMQALHYSVRPVDLQTCQQLTPC